MGKLSYEEKVNIYKDRQAGMPLKEIQKKYDIAQYTLRYILKLIDKYGFEIYLKSKNRKYSVEEKMVMINRVINNKESVTSVAIDNGMTNKSPLQQWVKKYEENGYNIVERKRGRPTVKKKTNESKIKETKEEKIKRLEKQIEYLSAELEYSKKLRAVVQARKNRQQKKK